MNSEHRALRAMLSGMAPKRAEAYIRSFELPGIANQYRENAAVASLGILTPDGIDLDRVYPYLRAQAEKGDVTFELPLVGAVTLNAGDVERLYRCIQEG